MTRHINITPDDLTKPDPPAALADFMEAKRTEFEADLEAAKRRHPAYTCDDPGCGRREPCGKCRTGLRVIDGGAS